MKVTRRLRDQLGTVAREAADQARERLGRGEEEQAAPAVDAPGNRPRAAFAGVLDGRHLWLAVDATPGTLAVREAGTDRIVSLDTDLAEDDPRYRSVRSDLATLTGGDGRYDVVITAPGGKLHRVWTPPLVRNEPVRVPACDDFAWSLARTEDGTLQLVREPAPAGAFLLDVGSAPDDTMTLHLGGAPEGAELRLVDDENGEVLLTRPLAVDAGETVGVAVATIVPADVPEGVGLSASVYAGDLPVRRRANDLARPDNAVMLPQVQNPDDDGPLFSLVLRWLPDGVLRVRRPKGAGA